MFRFRSNGMVIRYLLSWTFDRLTVPLTFRPRLRIESHRAARADTSGLVNSDRVVDQAAPRGVREEAEEVVVVLVRQSRPTSQITKSGWSIRRPAEVRVFHPAPVVGWAVTIKAS
jgi:hypothetical protein